MATTVHTFAHLNGKGTRVQVDITLQKRDEAEGVLDGYGYRSVHTESGIIGWIVKDHEGGWNAYASNSAYFPADHHVLDMGIHPRHGARDRFVGELLCRGEAKREHALQELVATLVNREATRVISHTLIPYTEIFQG